MSAPRLQLLYDLGWYWAQVNGRDTLHLVPPNPGRLARTHCGLLPVAGAHLEPVVLVLFSDPVHCKSCKGKDA